MTDSVNGLTAVPQILFKLHFHGLQSIQFDVFEATLFINLDPLTLQAVLGMS